MKKFKHSFFAVCFAICLMTGLMAVTANAKSLDPIAYASDYFYGMKWGITHFDDSIKIAAAIAKRDDSGIKDILDDKSEGQQTFLYALNPVATLAQIESTLDVTVSPLNNEKFQIRNVKVQNTGEELKGSSSPQKTSKFQYAFLAVPYFSHNQIVFDPILAYKTRNNELVVWCILKNYTGQEIELRRISPIEYYDNGKKIAGGTAAGFEKPFRMSYYEPKVTSGTIDGLPDQCFVKITFEPGTYDENVDITNLDYLESSYFMDYSPIS